MRIIWYHINEWQAFCVMSIVGTIITTGIVSNRHTFLLAKTPHPDFANQRHCFVQYSTANDLKIDPDVNQKSMGPPPWNNQNPQSWRSSKYYYARWFFVTFLGLGNFKWPFGKVKWLPTKGSKDHGLNHLAYAIKIWMFPKIVGFPPNHPLKNSGVPLFSPSILGCFPLFLVQHPYNTVVIVYNHRGCPHWGSRHCEASEFDGFSVWLFVGGN